MLAFKQIEGLDGGQQVRAYTRGIEPLLDLFFSRGPLLPTMGGGDVVDLDRPDARLCEIRNKPNHKVVCSGKEPLKLVTAQDDFADKIGLVRMLWTRLVLKSDSGNRFKGLLFLFQLSRASGGQDGRKKT